VTKLITSERILLNKAAGRGSKVFPYIFLAAQKNLRRCSRYNNQPKIVAARPSHSPLSVGGHAESTCEKRNNQSLHFHANGSTKTLLRELQKTGTIRPPIAVLTCQNDAKKAIRHPLRQIRILLQLPRLLLH
jgi:hypothetical protein